MKYKGYSIIQYHKKSVYFGYEIKDKENRKTYIEADTLDIAKTKIDNDIIEKGKLK